MGNYQPRHAASPAETRAKLERQNRKLVRDNHELIGIARELGEGFEESLDLAEQSLHTAHSSVERLDAIAERALDIAKLALHGELPTGALTPEEMAEAAERFPHWSIRTGFAHGAASKSYTRKLDDLRLELAASQDVYYLYGGDGEYSDYQLAQIFGGYSISGDLGTFPNFTITSEDASPISHVDIARLEVADAYLMETGHFVTREQADFGVVNEAITKSFNF